MTYRCLACEAGIPTRAVRRFARASTRPRLAWFRAALFAMLAVTPEGS